MENELNNKLETEALESLVAADLSARMKQWEQQSQGPAPRRWRWLWIVAGICLVGMVYFIAIRPKTDKSPAPIKEEPPTLSPDIAPTVPGNQPEMARNTTPAEKNRYIALLNTQYRAPDFSDNVRGDSPAMDGPVAAARKAYTEKKYQSALLLLQDVPNEYATDADYLKGHILMAQKKYRDASGVFKKLQKSVRYGEAAEWYGVLALLPDFDNQKALVLKKVRKMTSDPDHTYNSEASNLLKAILKL